VSTCRYLYLGLYASEAAAAQAYDLATLKIRGKACQTNFPSQQYIDAGGQLPPDEHLDVTIADLKEGAARQLLEELSEDVLVDREGTGPADQLAAIRQRVGLRRMAGLEQELIAMLHEEPAAAAQDHSTAVGATAAARSDETQDRCPGEDQHQPRWQP